MQSSSSLDICVFMEAWIQMCIMAWKLWMEIFSVKIISVFMLASGSQPSSRKQILTYFTDQKMVMTKFDNWQFIQIVYINILKNIFW